VHLLPHSGFRVLDEAAEIAARNIAHDDDATVPRGFAVSAVAPSGLFLLLCCSFEWRGSFAAGCPSRATCTMQRPCQTRDQQKQSFSGPRGRYTFGVVQEFKRTSSKIQTETVPRG
jgi:hypothetical protein